MALFGTSDSPEDKVLVPWDTVFPLTLSQPGREGVGKEVRQDMESLGTWTPGPVHSAHQGS